MEIPFKKLLRELDKLSLPIGDYAIFGSGPLAVRGLKNASDLDIIVTQDLFKTLHRKFPQDISKHPFGCLVIGENIEIGDKWQGNPSKVREYIRNAELIDGYPFVRLKYVLEWKEKSNKEDDKNQVEIIRKFLLKNK